MLIVNLRRVGEFQGLLFPNIWCYSESGKPKLDTLKTWVNSIITGPSGQLQPWLVTIIQFPQSHVLETWFKWYILPVTLLTLNLPLLCWVPALLGLHYHSSFPKITRSLAILVKNIPNTSPMCTPYHWTLTSFSWTVLLSSFHRWKKTSYSLKYNL